jgi:hypothetical protein
MATRYASAALTWNPGYHARRRAPLYTNLMKAVRMGLIVAALTCLGLTLLSAIRGHSDSIGASLTVGAARAEVAD